jgi:hypothetical protein
MPHISFRQRRQAEGHTPGQGNEELADLLMRSAKFQMWLSTVIGFWLRRLFYV